MTDEELKTPTEWATERGIIIMDPDGWRGGDLYNTYGPKDFNEPIGRTEFNYRVMSSTIYYGGLQK